MTKKPGFAITPTDHGPRTTGLILALLLVFLSLLPAPASAAGTETDDRPIPALPAESTTEGQPDIIVTVQLPDGEAMTGFAAGEKPEAGRQSQGGVICAVPDGTHIMCAVDAGRHSAIGGTAMSGKPDATLGISLLYGDQKGQSAHPDGSTYYTTSTMSGYIKLEPNSLAEDLENAYVTLTIPKEYVEKGSINIPRFTSDSPVTEYEIIPVTEEGESYRAGIRFRKYDKTQTLTLPFALSFLDNAVPSNYELPVTASVSCGGTTITAEPNIYKPKYKDWAIDKFVNSNKLDTFRKDGAEVIVTAQEEGDDPYLDDRTYVNFAFMVNNVNGPGRGLDDYCTIFRSRL